MNREDAIAILRALADQSRDDPEVAHSGADAVLCDLLVALGYTDVVAEWRKVKKWYA